MNKSEWPKDYKEQFWNAYPRKVGKRLVYGILERLRKSGEVTFDQLMDGVHAYVAQGRDMQFTAHPSTWLRQGRWEDEYAPTGSFGLTGPHGCWIALDSPEWRAWTQHRGRPFALDKRGGWIAPSQWPPGYDLNGGGPPAGNG